MSGSQIGRGRGTGFIAPGRAADSGRSLYLRDVAAFPVGLRPETMRVSRTSRHWRMQAKSRSTEWIRPVGERPWQSGPMVEICSAKGLGARLSVYSGNFDELNLHGISIRVLAYDRRAIRAYEKCAFVIEGRAREAAFVDEHGMTMSLWRSMIASF